MAAWGDTVRFEVQFRDFDGSPIVMIPSSVTLTIFDEDEKEIYTKDMNDSHRLGFGHYFYDYPLPEEYLGTYFYEFKGIFNSKPYLARDEFNVTFE